MTVTTDLPVPRRLAVLKWVLRRDGDLVLVAQLTGETVDDVTAIAAAHGWPDRAAVVAAVRDLERSEHQLLPAAAAQPHRRVPPVVRDGAVPAQVMLNIPLNLIDSDPDNPRSHLGDLSDLIATMSTMGLLQPILVRRTGQRFTVVAGHRRLAAARRLRWPTIPAYIRRDLRADRVLEAMLIENGARRALDPIDEAQALRRLARESKLANHQQIAARVGRSRAWVADRLALLDLPPEDQDRVRAGTLAIGAAAARARAATGTSIRRREPSSGPPASAEATSPQPTRCPTCGKRQ